MLLLRPYTSFLSITNIVFSFVSCACKLGDEKIDYHSDYQRGFPAVDVANYKQGNKKADLKKVLKEKINIIFVMHAIICDLSIHVSINISINSL